MTVDRWSRLIFQPFVFSSSLFFLPFVFFLGRAILSSELDF